MMNNFWKKKLAVMTAAALTFTALAVCCAVIAVFVPEPAAFAAAAAIFGFASGAAALAALRFVKREAAFISEIEKRLENNAYLRYDKRRRKTFISDNFASVSGITPAGEALCRDDYDKIKGELTSNRGDSEENIYSCPVPDRWLRVSEYENDDSCILIISDDTKYYSCKNVIRSLKYYDRETGVLCREAFIAKVREISEGNTGSDAIGIIHVVIGGIDKLTSFSGTAAADGVIGRVASYIKKYENPHNTFAGRTATSEFSILISETYDDGCKKMADKINSGLQEVLGAIPYIENSNVRAFCGYACFHGNDNNVSNMISSADFAAFDAEKHSSASPVAFSSATFETTAQEFRKVQVFNSLVANNRVDYHFQPIVNARTGAIYAYEALMRPQVTDGIKLTPLEMLDIAEKQDMLYEIELLTFRNTLRHLSLNQEMFSSRKLFINCIPSVVFSDTDYAALLDNYGTLFNKIVVEITEGTPAISDAITAINNRYRKHRAQVAMDDYGTGYSNDATLLSVKPDYIKIDRSIIMDIDKDPQKQHLVANMVDFCGQHGISTLAEGVETAEEMETIIALHVDYIQGYYTSRASAVLILDIPEEIQKQIINLNLKYSGNISKAYEITTIEPVNIVDLALAGYTEILIKKHHATINGNPDIPVKMRIISEMDGNSTLFLNDVNIECDDSCAITVPKGGDMNLDISGRNTLTRGSIRVPDGSSLYVCGNGELTISCNKASSFGIGGTSVQDYGRIKIDSEGRIIIDAKGDNIIGIGGGVGSPDSSVDIISGTVEMKLNGIEVTGIGSFMNETVININPVKLDINAAGQKVVGIGSKSGHVNISCSADIEANISGDSCCCIGSLERGAGSITVNGGTADITVRGKNIAGIGAVNGNIETVINAGVQKILCEGDNATCIGDNFGSGTVRCRGSMISAIARASNENPVGVKNGKVYVDGGSITTSGVDPVECYSPEGEKLVRVRLDGGNDFSRTVKSGKATYAYSAKANGEEDMYVYLPEEYA